jgi:16S rRNA (guanine966-N2)-methyltransferase
MRIVGGTRRGRRLLGPRSASTRPTADRVRETLFNVLGQTLPGGHVLDLYAGTGALGLEALSRGADSAILVDSAKEAADLCRANATALGFEERVAVLRLPVDRALERLVAEERHFGLILADPPYAARAGAWLVAAVEPLLAGSGTLVIEHDRREVLPPSGGALFKVDERRFGDSVLSLYSSEPSWPSPSIPARSTR